MTGYQLWSVERLENKLVDLRELYNEKILFQQQNQLLNITAKSPSSFGFDSNSRVKSMVDLNIDKEHKNRNWDRQSPVDIFSTLFESQVNFYVFIFYLYLMFLGKT